MSNLRDLFDTPANLQRLGQALQEVAPEAIGEYLDENWQGWRRQNVAEDYILYAVGFDCHLIGLGFKPGELDIDGELYYSASWL